MEFLIDGMKPLSEFKKKFPNNKDRLSLEQLIVSGLVEVGLRKEVRYNNEVKQLPIYANTMPKTTRESLINAFLISLYKEDIEDEDHKRFLYLTEKGLSFLFDYYSKKD